MHTMCESVILKTEGERMSSVVAIRCKIELYQPSQYRLDPAHLYEYRLTSALATLTRVLGILFVSLSQRTRRGQE